MSPTDAGVALTIDGKEVTVPRGTLIIRAAEQLGIQIPRFCDHPFLEPAGACRQCYVQIEGQPPSLLRPPSGCPFHPRCEFAMDICRQELPALEELGGPEHLFRCHLDGETRAEVWSVKKAAMNAEVTAA